MAKTKRKVVGSFNKSKETTKPPYIKIRGDVVLKDGTFLRVESKKFQLESLQSAVAAGKLSGEVVEQITDRINKIPDWVLGEVVMLETSE